MSTTFEATNIVETVIAPEVNIPETVAKDAAAIVGIELTPDYAALFTGPKVDALPATSREVAQYAGPHSEEIAPFMGPIVSVGK